MPHKLVIGDKGLAWRTEIDSSVLDGKSVGESFKGEDINADLTGYEFEISGASDFSGFPHKSDIDGIALKRVILTKGWGMKDSRDGIRKRKTVRGKVLSEKTTQVNLRILKQGNKSLSEIFVDQNKKEEPKLEGASEVVAEPSA